MINVGEILSNSGRLHPESLLISADGAQKISYHHLAKNTASLAQELVQLGLGNGQRLGIFLPKSVESVTAIFATLQAGASYVPADVYAPKERAEYIFSDSQVAFIITNEEYGKDLCPGFTRILVPNSEFLLIAGEWSSKEPLSTPPDLAYVLYTSGSTGRPKGVMITHQNALSFITWAGDQFAVEPQDTLTSIAPFHFDLSVFDLFVSINRGADLILIDAKTAKNPRLFAQVIAERGISLLYATPSLLQLLLRFGKLGDHDYTQLKTVLYAGEVFPVSPLQQLTESWTRASFFNLYGPTETNVVTWQRVPKLSEGTQVTEIPIGHACPFAKCALLINGDISVEQDRPGELIVTGASVAAGYLGARAETMSTLVDHDGNRWYRTGDLATINASGAFVFRGRLDQMVKRRGYRIEPAEVERALLRHPAIDQAVVISYTTAKQEVKIQAFLTATSGEETPDFLALKLHCQQNLPLYMLPDGFRFLPEIPQTSSQKIDYQRLKSSLNA